MSIFQTSHSNYRIVNNSDKPLNKFDLTEYQSRTEKVYYNNTYLGYKGIVYTPIDLPKLDIDQDAMWEHWKYLADRNPSQLVAELHQICKLLGNHLC